MRKRPEAVLAGLVGAILVLAVLAVALAPGRGTVTYPQGSPERALQSYLQAVIKGDTVAAFSYIANESDCTQADMDSAYVLDVSRVDMESVQTSGDRSTIRVRLEFDNGVVFGNTYGEEQTFRLVRESGDWKISGNAWPMYSCGEWVK